MPNLLSKVWSSRPYHIFESKNKSSTECIVFPSCFAAKLWRMHKRNTHEGVRRVEARTRAQEVGSSTVCIQLACSSRSTSSMSHSKQTNRLHPPVWIRRGVVLCLVVGSHCWRRQSVDTNSQHMLCFLCATLPIGSISCPCL